MLAGVLQLPGLISTAEIRRSQGAERSGRADLALSWARDAVSAEPWSASAYEQRGLVYESEGRFDQAANDLGQAISRESTNFSHWLLLARIETERGRLKHRTSAACRHLRRLADAFSMQFGELIRTRPMQGLCLANP